MTWKTLAEALNGATAKGFDIGEMAAATASQPKGADPEGPASSREILPAKEVHTDRCMTTAFPNGLPRPAVVIHLVVIEGGGARREGGSNVRRLRVSPKSKASELGIYVVG